MEEYSLKETLLFGGVVGAFFLLLAALALMVVCLRQSDMASCQLVIAQRMALYVDQEPETAGSAVAPALPANLRNEVYGKRDPLTALELLAKGGVFAGTRLSAIENHEISFLLKSLTSLCRARDNAPPDTTSYISLTILLRKKLLALSDALTFRALAARARVWIVFWLLFFWALVLLASGFYGLRIFRLREKRLRWANQALELEKELLQALPEALVLLDKTLSLKFVNRLAERYFGRLADSRKGCYWGRFCQDQSLLESLRNSWQVYGESPATKGVAEVQEISLRLGDNRQCLLQVQWYHLSLAGRDYLLGIFNDPEEGRAEDRKQADAQERLKELSTNLFKAQDEERRHLADELHDGLCQSLAALKMQVFGVERHIEKTELQEECRRARQFIAQIIEDVRRLSHDLSPVILDDLGLSDALVHLVNNFTALNNLKVSISVPDLDDVFAGDAARNIYRIVQEAINNVGKHAKASLVLLKAEIVGDEVSFSIKDDGVGFDLESTQKMRSGAGLGLASMAQRVHLLGGKFKLVSRPGEGCEIAFTIPKK
ncbi:MAG: hypothetical protein JXR80_10265 [Deltaproteobacteria bacterium]|nr:hypothetical protein [Deltaproteobacteria bacterium]